MCFNCEQQNNNICNKEHRYDEMFSNLPEAQDNQNGNRHVCAGCAYEAGIKDALNGIEPRTNLSNLPLSQAGTVRHKDARAAYRLGYDIGQEKRRTLSS